MPTKRDCACGCGRSTAGGRFLPGHNTVAHYATIDRTALFWSHVDKRGDDECWLWTRLKNRNGYGVKRWYGKNVYAHRIAYALTHGPIGDGLSVLHECDKPPCCNPKHLRLGSQSDNMRDATIRQRMPLDTQNHRALNIEFRGEIHSLAGWARMFGLCRHALHERLKRYGWTVERALTTPVRKKKHHRSVTKY